MYVANEGKLVAFVPAASTPTPSSPRCAPTRWARTPRSSARASRTHPGMVVARTGFGGTRVVDLPIGEQLPRIC